MAKWSGLFILSVAIIIIGLYLLFRALAYPTTVTVVSQEETRDKIELSYPQIQGLSKTEVRNTFNQAIREEIEGFVAKVNTPDHSGKVSYKIEYNDNYLLSVTLSELFYVQYAAHPMTYLRSFTINTKSGEIYKFQNIFKQDVGYADKINLIINQQITERQMPLLKPFKGIGDNQEFYFSAEGLVVYYQLYEYTPYFYGFPKITIPYAQIGDVLKNDIVELIAK